MKAWLIEMNGFSLAFCLLCLARLFAAVQSTLAGQPVLIIYDSGSGFCTANVLTR